jgi:hypothetical protein
MEEEISKPYNENKLKNMLMIMITKYVISYYFLGFHNREMQVSN